MLHEERWVGRPYWTISWLNSSTSVLASILMGSKPLITNGKKERATSVIASERGKGVVPLQVKAFTVSVRGFFFHVGVLNL